MFELLNTLNKLLQPRPDNTERLTLPVGSKDLLFINKTLTTVSKKQSIVARIRTQWVKETNVRWNTKHLTI